MNCLYVCVMLEHRLRELTTAEIGRLVSVTGVVTRTSEVRPELLQGTFKCLECGGVIKNVEQQFKYTEVNLLEYFYMFMWVNFHCLAIIDVLLHFFGFSPQFVRMQHVPIGQIGHCYAKIASLLTGRGWECRRLPKRFQLDPCPGHWMLFSAMILSNKPELETRKIPIKSICIIFFFL